MHNPVSTYFTNQIFSQVSKDIENRLERVFQTAVNRYAQVSFENNTSNNESIVPALIQNFPTFPFVAASSFNQIQELKSFGKLILLAYITTKIYETEYDSNIINSFISCFNKKDSSDTLSKKLTEENRDHAYIPKAVYKDLRYIRPISTSMLKSSNMQERVENCFYYEGVSQFFLRYYFELLTKSQNDTIATHLDEIFGTFFQLFHREEVLYWQTQGTKQGAKNNLLLQIDQDSVAVKHPQIRKNLFLRLHSFNPIIHDGKAYSSSSILRNTLTRQLESFHNMSYSKTSQFLKHVENIKGRPYLIYLLSQIRRRGSDQLSQFHEFLRDNYKVENAAITKVVDLYLKKFASKTSTGSEKSAIGLAGGTTTVGKTRTNQSTGGKQLQAKAESRKIVGGKIDFTEDSTRLKHAARNLESLKDRPSLAYPQIEQYLEEQLESFINNAKIEGALTKDGIDDYLKQFAHLTDNLLHQESIDIQSLSALSGSTNRVLKSFLQTGVLTAAEVEDYKKMLQDRMKELAEANIAKRINILGQISSTLTEASSGKKQKQDKDLSFFDRESIPLGFEENSPKISPKNFFEFPFSKQRKKPDEDYFQIHKKYLELSVEKSKINEELLEQIIELIPNLQKREYKKYFNVFPNNEYDDCILMAVYSLWQNKAFGKMLVEET